MCESDGIVTQADQAQSPITERFVEDLVKCRRGRRILQKNLRTCWRADSEDVMQESYLALWRNRHRIRNADAAMGYFYRTVQLQAWNYRRGPLDMAIAAGLIADDTFRYPAETEEFLNQELLATLVAKLSPKYKLEFFCWCARGYQNHNQSQRCAFTRLLKRLHRVAKVPHVGGGFHRNFCERKQ